MASNNNNNKRLVSIMLTNKKKIDEMIIMIRCVLRDQWSLHGGNHRHWAGLVLPSPATGAGGDPGWD